MGFWPWCGLWGGFGWFGGNDLVVMWMSMEVEMWVDEVWFMQSESMTVEDIIYSKVIWIMCN